jgi:hypothetical protein
LTDPPPPAPFHDVTNGMMSAIEKLAKIFSKMAQPKDTTQPTTTPAPTVAALLPRVTTPDMALPTLTPPPTDTTPLPRVAATTPRQPAVISQEQDPERESRPTQFPHRYLTRAKARSLGSAFAAIVLTESPYNKAPTYTIPMAMPVTHPLTGKLLTYRQLNNDPEFKELWNKSGAHELGRLSQGVGTRIQGTDTIFFIKHSKFPTYKMVTYGRFVCDIRPQKAEKERKRLSVGGNLINYVGDMSTQTSDLTTSKCLWNSVVSTPDAEYMCLDLKNLYLETPMEEYEYMRLHISDIPDKII